MISYSLNPLLLKYKYKFFFFKKNFKNKKTIKLNGVKETNKNLAFYKYLVNSFII